MVAEMRNQKLHILNCNLHTEASDILGGFRPTRGRSEAKRQFLTIYQNIQDLDIWKEYGMSLSAIQTSYN